MTCYLASCMTYYDQLGQFEKAIEWRAKSSDKLNDINIKTFDPTKNYIQNKEYNPCGVVLQNKMYLDKADFLLVNLEYLEYSQGTLFELFYAYLFKKPVIAFGTNSIIHQPHVHASISIAFATLDEALEYISNMYCQVV